MARNQSPSTTRHSKAQAHVLAVLAGSLTLASVGMLLVSDAFPRLFAPTARRLLAAFPLASIALAYVAHQRARWSEPWQLAKTVVLSAAFLFWAANQFWPDLPQAAMFNDLAIAFFVTDVFLTIVDRSKPA